ncbi:MAG: helix-turn-helix domain-containing protein [Alphaproteobacteria bacterium]|nr:helix-turn-helix domain-containing protein [Alphaproteobacteria bacterium]
MKKPERWTPSLVADQLEDAVATLRKLPPVVVQGYFNLWPKIKYTELEVLQQDQPPLKLRPRTEEITRLEETFTWMGYIEVDERKLVWKRAAKVRWKRICMELGCDRSTAWRQWVFALAKIATFLNERDGGS